MMKSYVEVSIYHRTMHCWPDAPKNRGYLRKSHPHNFRVTLEIQVFDDDREIEFHNLQDDLLNVAVFEMENSFSCETWAKRILEHLQKQHQIGNQREIEVSVAEELDVKGIVKYSPTFIEKSTPLCKTLQALIKIGGSGTASEVAEELGKTRAHVSSCLNSLAACGRVTKRRERQKVYYEVIE